MEEGITIGELDGGTGGHHQNVRLKALVLLREPKICLRIGRGRCGINGSSWHWRQPYDGIGKRSMSALRGPCHLDAAPHGRDLREHAGAQRQHSDPGSRMRHGSAFVERPQNSTPIIRLTWSAL